MSETRDCGGCDGSGKDEPDTFLTFHQWRDLPPCPACLGSGIVNDALNTESEDEYQAYLVYFEWAAANPFGAFNARG